MRRRKPIGEGQTACQCEHASHFFEGAGPGSAGVTERVMSPNGNPNHGYGTPYYNHYILTVKTSGGTFNVCKDCVKDCLATECLCPVCGDGTGEGNYCPTCNTQDGEVVIG